MCSSDLPGKDIAELDLDFLVNDAATDSALATISLTVNPVNDLPTANDATVTTDEDTNLNVLISGSDIDGDSLTYQVVTQPANGSISGTAPNLIYTPNADFNGTDSFSYLVNDGTVDSIEATVSISINTINDAPTANVSAVTIDKD